MCKILIRNNKLFFCFKIKTVSCWSDNIDMAANRQKLIQTINANRI